MEQIRFKKVDNAMEARNASSARRAGEARRRKYWERLLARLNEASDEAPGFFERVGITSRVWLPVGTGIAGVQYCMRPAGGKANVKFEIHSVNKERNDELFDYPYGFKREIEDAFGEELSWNRVDGNTHYRIVSADVDADALDEDKWDKAIDYHCEAIRRLHDAMQPKLDEFHSGR